MHMNAPVPPPVKALGSEIGVLLGAEKMRLRHFHTAFFRHQAIGIFNSANIPRVLRRGEFDNPRLEACLMLLLSVDNFCLIVAYLRNDLIYCPHLKNGHTPLPCFKKCSAPDCFLRMCMRFRCCKCFKPLELDTSSTDMGKIIMHLLC